MSNVRIDEMIRPQRKMRGWLIIIELTKMFILWTLLFQLLRGVLEGVFLMSHAVIRNLVTKFWPKTRYQAVGLMKQLDCRNNLLAPLLSSEDLMFQLKSYWTVSKRLVASDSETVWKNRLIFSKAILNPIFNGFISKELTLK